MARSQVEEVQWENKGCLLSGISWGRGRVVLGAFPESSARQGRLLLRQRSEGGESKAAQVSGRTREVTPVLGQMTPVTVACALCSREDSAQWGDNVALAGSEPLGRDELLPDDGLGFPVCPSSFAGAGGPGSKPSRARLSSAIQTSPLGVKSWSLSGKGSASHCDWPAAIKATTS